MTYVSFQFMEDFRKRSTASFGGLGVLPSPTHLEDPMETEPKGNLTGEQHFWMPSMDPVYRDSDYIEDSSSGDELEEMRRRAVPTMETRETGPRDPQSSFSLGEDDFEYDQAVGARPSIEFCSQLDKEDERDLIDIRSLQFDDRDGASPHIHHQGLLDGKKRIPSKGLPSALKKESAGAHDTLNKRNKRVSFTGLPEIPKPYLPPHKRSLCAAGQSRDVPDYVKNPSGYTHYEFDEPVIVGSGMMSNNDTLH